MSCSDFRILKFIHIMNEDIYNLSTTKRKKGKEKRGKKIFFAGKRRSFLDDSEKFI